MCAGLDTTFLVGISTAVKQRNLSTVVGGRYGREKTAVGCPAAEPSVRQAVVTVILLGRGWLNRFFTPSAWRWILHQRKGRSTTRPCYEGLLALLMMFET